MNCASGVMPGFNISPADGAKPVFLNAYLKQVMQMYTVYYIPSKKYVGCTNNLKQRLQGFPGRGSHGVALEDVIVLFESDDIYAASIEEQENQRLLLGKADGRYYHKYQTEEILEKKRIGMSNLNKGRPMNETHKQKMSEFHKGKPKSKSHKKKIGDAQRGKILSDVHRKNLSLACKGKSISQEVREKIAAFHHGKVKSLEHKNKIAESHRGRIWITNGKQQYCIFPDRFPEFEVNGYTRGRLKNVDSKLWLNTGFGRAG